MFQLVRPYVSAPYPSPTVIAIGNFDGVHPGHKSVLRRAVESAAAMGAVPAALTFDPHPSRLFRPQSAAPRILTLSDKLRRLGTTGIKTLFLQHFTRAFSEMSAEDFVQHYLIGRLNAKQVIVGEDFIFGHKRGGDAALLKSLIAAEIMPPFLAPDGEAYSSTRIRAAIREGDMAKATLLLGTPFSIRARVREGQKLGRTIGFPTLNLRLQPELVQPPYGVYAGYVNERLPAVMNFGVRPTVAEAGPPLLEVHVLGQGGAVPAYGERVMASLTRMLRPEMKFSGLEELKSQIAKDCAAAVNILQVRPS